MDTVTLADAKARLSELVERALQGEPVRITRRGKPVVELVALPKTKTPFDWASLTRLREGQTMSTESSGDFVRRMRDEYRY